MSNTTPTVICIPAKPEVVRASKRQLRVAAYCRVSTDDEEQLTSYEAQKNYYTDKIMTNKAWTMAGIFADEGITGTSARKRPEFLRMIRQCKQGKIDIVLTKSISRFARNTVDCLNYVRALKELGIAVIFEKENMNTLEIDSEILITMLGAFAQSESESISANVRWGIRQAMKEGKATIQYKYLYGYRRGDDGKPEIIPDQAEVVRKIYDLFLSGTPVRGIQEYLNTNSVPNIKGEPKWARSAIDSVPGIYVPRPHAGKFQSAGWIRVGDTLSVGWRVISGVLAIRFRSFLFLERKEIAYATLFYARHAAVGDGADDDVSARSQTTWRRNVPQPVLLHSQRCGVRILPEL